MKRKGQVLKVPVRNHEFEVLLQRASEITSTQRPPLKMRPLLLKAFPSIAR